MEQNNKMEVINAEIGNRIKFVDCKWHGMAQRRATWARRIAKVEGGWMCFESMDDYTEWKETKK